MTLLWWEAMRQFSITHDEIDLVGLGTPNIERFKRSFSPRTVEFLDTSRYASSAVGLLLRGGDHMRRLVGVG